MKKILQRQEILKLVKEGRITPEEGLNLIKSVVEGRKTELPQEEAVPGTGVVTASIESGCKIPDEEGKSSGSKSFPASIKGDIAIIGMSGMFPDARNVDEFWDNLAAGKSSIREIPRDRWKWDRFISSDLRFANIKLNSQWGAFLSDIDQFDPFFFNLSVKEAELMDPRQRLFMQEAWKALEDAGYSDEELDEKECGIFVGCQEGDYIKAYKGDINSYLPTGSSNSILAARIAYFLNLKGPAIAVDTACSSALTAIHMACQNIRSKTCGMALAGGVLAMSTPAMFLGLDKLGMFSPEGECRVFDNDANGTVIGEAVGVVVLKSLEDAERDKDHIYGVILGSEINQDGKTSGITAPSASSQTALETKLYKHIGINPETISYIEAHGTGTKLGDPIEIHALTDAFRKFTDKKRFCAVGSVKSNIGHSMPAAGISSLIKVLCCIKNKKLVPSINFNKENSHINFEESPFYVNTALKSWDTEQGGARRAAISSFGFSGTNSHIIIEEFNEAHVVETVKQKPCHIVLLSAKTKGALENRVRDLMVWLERNGKQNSMEDICFTLNCGRSHFQYRIACIAGDCEELRNVLDTFLHGGMPESVRVGSLDIKKKPSAAVKDQMNIALRELNAGNIDESTYRSRLLELAKLYAEGNNADWGLLYKRNSCRRISMPVYPFDRKKYWIQMYEEKTDGTVKIQTGDAKLHPLIHRNTSTMELEKFCTDISGNEFFVTDHVINKTKIIPGAVQIEMASAAGNIACGKKVRRISNVVWIKPIMVEGSSSINTCLNPAGDSLSYEVYGTDYNGDKLTYSQGRLHYNNLAACSGGTLDIETLKKRKASFMSGDECYSLFKSMGFEYGQSFRTIKELYIYKDEALSKLELPEALKQEEGDFILHPSLLDGAFQTIMGVSASRKMEADVPNLPFILENIEIYRPLPNICYVYIKLNNHTDEKSSKLRKYDMTITDQNGCVLVSINNFSLKAISRADRSEKAAESLALQGGIRKEAGNSCRVIYIDTEWVKASAAEPTGNLHGNVLVFEKDGQMKKALRLDSAFSDCRIISVRSGSSFGKNADDYVLRTGNADDYKTLFDNLDRDGIKPFLIIHTWCREEFSLSEDHLEGQLRDSIYSMNFLIGELSRQKNLNSVKIIYFLKDTASCVNPIYAAVNGFSATLRQENTKISLKTVAFDDEPEAAVQYLRNEVNTGDSIEVKYINGERFIKRFKELKPDFSCCTGTRITQHGVYIITGGMGGIGQILSRYLAQTYNARLVLAGRSPLNGKVKDWLEELKSLGGEAVYVSADVATADGTREIKEKAKMSYGRIDGAIHCAGITRDSYIRSKTPEEIDAVLSPKVKGTVYLYEAFKNEDTDFLMLFSSIASILGNAGQSDYAYANGFMNSFADFVNNKRDHRMKIISVNWPLWRDGGMKPDKEYEEMTRKLTGMLPLPYGEGLEVFENALQSDCEKLVAVYGYTDKIREVLGLFDVFQKDDTLNEKRLECSMTSNKPVNSNLMETYLLEDLIRIASNFARGYENGIGPDDDIQECGFDSVAITAYSNELNDRFDLRLTPAVFFELDDPTIRSLMKYLVKEYKDKLNMYYKNRIEAETASGIPAAAETVKAAGRLGAVMPELPAKDAGVETKKMQEEAIAIIGLNAVMPQSQDVWEFWENLEAERNMVTGIPSDRAKWLEEIQGAKCGGFMKEVDKFDCDFFNISPREAKMMDPQQRIMLEVVWKTIEDAGYNPRELAGTKVGMFIGVSSSDYYDLLLKNNIKIDAVASMGISNSIRANRLSFQYDFRGPSEPIDTACSSSLVAIHRGVEAIRSGMCDMALAGGVNVILTPTLFNAFNAAGMLSGDGKCKTFDSRANGYVRGEGAGAVLLKPISKALEDGDDIYAVIRSTMENHGGRAKSLTSPNANAQAQLLVDAYSRAGVEPDTVTYIEAHGTGTSLGDPVEVNGLKKAFKELYSKYGKTVPDKACCGLGSVKSNIGHLEAAAGIAGIIKVIMAMNQGKIPATINFKELNPYIDLEGSPFYIVNNTKLWQHLKDEKGNIIPRRGGISAFGYGGSNAHIVLEECMKLNPAQRAENIPQLIVLSAKNSDRLKEYAAELAEFLRRRTNVKACNGKHGSAGDIKRVLMSMASHAIGVREGDLDPGMELVDYGFDMVALSSLTEQINSKFGTSLDSAAFYEYRTIDAMAAYISGDSGESCAHQGIPLEKIAYTLQTGREHMEERLAMVITSLEELYTNLRCFIEGKKADGIYRGSTDALTGNGGRCSEDRITTSDPYKCAQAFVSGGIPDWTLLHSDGVPGRVHLPTYCFERQRHWFESDMLQEGLNLKPPVQSGKSAEQARKLVMKNTQSYSAGQESITEAQAAVAVQETVAAVSSADIENKLKSMLAAVLYTDILKIDINKPFIELGLDSILGVEFAKKLKDEFKVEIKTTKLYDYSTVKELAKYLASLGVAATGLPNHTVPKASETEADFEQSDRQHKLLQECEVECSTGGDGQAAPAHPTVQEKQLGSSMDVAIIGIAARYPCADNTEQFWQNLKDGRDCVTEVPKERWDAEKLYHPDINMPGKVYSKWGGFLEDVDKFDPLFFNISPAEAEKLDPQQRLFLQEVWRALEDAGYSAENMNNMKCGIYAGVMTGSEYPPNIFNVNSMLAARAAYFLNLKGPALSIDTACSSSLVAMHLACRSLIDGETDMMIAGGVTLYLTAKPYMGMCKSGMLSHEGKCKTFDDTADGFVPGEGVGVVVLKRFDRAVKDGDHIYGIIKGSGINQDGKTNGITAPSAQSQAQLELEVYKNSGINPETITYIECHGTGTKLGDPIEMDALMQSFGHYTSKVHFCKVGAAKSNIGHTSAASGVAGVIKVLLSLKHGMIPPTIHFKKANEHINFENSPFVVNTELTPWDTPAGAARRAAVSAFGYSGTNAHVVIEEPPVFQSPANKKKLPFYLLPLSAKNRNVLENKIAELRLWLDGEGSQMHIGDIAYTLGAGRSHFDHRFSTVASDIQDLKNSLDAYISGQKIECCLSGKASNTTEYGFAAKQTVRYVMEKLPKAQQNILDYKELLLALGEFYVKGVDMDWNSIYEGCCYRRISAPVYPFKRDGYWLAPASEEAAVSSETELKKAVFNPLEGLNKSRDGRNLFELRLTGNEFFLRDNVVYNKRILPGVAYLEMARAAGEAAENKKVRQIRKLFWTSPITADDNPVDVEIELLPEGGEKAFSISTKRAGGSETNARGEIIFDESEIMHTYRNESLDLDAVRKRCTRSISGAECYKGFEKRLFVIGPGLQAIQVMYYNDTEALAELRLPSQSQSLENFVLHPSIMDAALQTVTGLQINAANELLGRPYLSFSLREAAIVRPLTDKCYVYAKFSNKKLNDNSFRLFDIKVVNPQGNTQVVLNDFCIKQPIKNWEGYNQAQQAGGTEKTVISDVKDVQSEVLREVAVEVCNILKLNQSELDFAEALIDYGFTSISMIEFIDTINSKYGIDSSTELFFEEDTITINSLSQSIYKNFAEKVGEYYVGPLVLPDTRDQFLSPQDNCKNGDSGAIDIEYSVPVAATDKGAEETGNDMPEKVKENIRDMWEFYRKIEEDILKMFEGEHILDENGYNLLKVGELVGRINGKYNIKVQAEALIESPSMGAFVKELVRNNKEKLYALTGKN